VTVSQIAAIAGVVIAGALVAFTIPALVQLKRTLKALEESVRGVTPNVVSATSNLDQVLGRADRVLRGVEEGTHGINTALGSFGRLVSSLAPRSGPTWLVTLLGLASGLKQAWRTVVSPRPGAAAPPASGPKGGTKHD